MAMPLEQISADVAPYDMNVFAEAWPFDLERKKERKGGGGGESSRGGSIQCLRYLISRG